MSVLTRMRAVTSDRPADARVTLAELMVTISVGSLVLAASAVLFNAALRSNAITIERVDTINSGRVAMSAMTRALRTAVLPSQLDEISSAPDTAAFLKAGCQQRLVLR